MPLEVTIESLVREFVQSQISGRFWIVAAYEAIRAWRIECSVCKRCRNKPATQKMGPLPQRRLPFKFCAFDQTGLITTIGGPGRQQLKRWLCDFTRLSNSAVHFEIAWGLDTDSLLNALTRITRRRGIHVPKDMISDNVTNFFGAVNELKELVGQLDKDEIQETTAQKGVKWTFNLPRSPHFGEAQKVMGKAAKKAVYPVLSSSEVTDEDLITVVTGAESLLNSRALTYRSTKVKDEVPLTPNNFPWANGWAAWTRERRH